MELSLKSQKFGFNTVSLDTESLKKSKFCICRYRNRTFLLLDLQKWLILFNSVTPTIEFSKESK